MVIGPAVAPVAGEAGVVDQPEALAVKSTVEVKPAGAAPVKPVAVNCVAATLIVLGALHHEPATILLGALKVEDKRPLVGSIKDPKLKEPLPPATAPMEHRRVTKPVTGKDTTVCGVSCAKTGALNPALAMAARVVRRSDFLNIIASENPFWIETFDDYNWAAMVRVTLPL
jgi:hypothetical protein